MKLVHVPITDPIYALALCTSTAAHNETFTNIMWPIPQSNWSV